MLSINPPDTLISLSEYISKESIILLFSARNLTSLQVSNGQSIFELYLQRNFATERFDYHRSIFEQGYTFCVVFIASSKRGMSSPRVLYTFATDSISHVWRIAPSFRKIMAVVKSLQKRRRRRWIIKESKEPSNPRGSGSGNIREWESGGIVTLSDVSPGFVSGSPTRNDFVLSFTRTLQGICIRAMTTANGLFVVPEAKAPFLWMHLIIENNFAIWYSFYISIRFNL